MSSLACPLLGGPQTLSEVVCGDLVLRVVKDAYKVEEGGWCVREENSAVGKDGGPACIEHSTEGKQNPQSIEDLHITRLLSWSFSHNNPTLVELPSG